MLLIPAVYQAIRLIYGISYDLGTPAAAMILAIIVMNHMRDMGRNPLHKIVVFSLLLFGVEWLDIVPKLNGFGFGRGAVSQDIKTDRLIYQCPGYPGLYWYFAVYYFLSPTR